MNNRLKKTFLSISFFSIITAFIFIHLNKKAQLHKQITLNIPTQPNNCDTLIAKLITEEKLIWQTLSKDYDCSAEDFNQLRKELLSNFEEGQTEILNEDKRKISKKTSEYIISIMREFNVDPNSISICSWRDKSAAASTDCALLINEKALKALPVKAQKFIIAHELQHIINKDCSTNYILQQILNPDQQKLHKDHPINKLSRFQEMRADTHAALKGPDYAQGYQEFMNILVKKGENSGISHPKTTIRVSQSNSILNQFYA